MGLYKNIALFFSFEIIPEEPIEVTCIVEVIELKEEKNYLDKYTLKIIDFEKNNRFKNKKFIAYIEKELEFNPGDVILVKGNLERAEEARNFYSFNNRNYLKQKKIYGIIEVEDIKYLESKKDKYFFIGLIKNSIQEKTEYLYDEKYKDVVQKILFGINGSIDEDLNEDFRDAGISHILAISGLHITYVVFLISFIFDKAIKNIRIKNLLICICLLLFLIITGLSPSCIRACIMTIFSIISKNIYKKNNIYISIIFSFIILVFSNVFVVYNVGMWLSFLGTLGIVLFYPFIKLVIRVKGCKIFSKVVDIILISFSAQILIWPVVLYTFNTISLAFFVSNVLISFLIGPIVLLGYLSIIFSYFIFPIGKVFAIIQEFLLEILFFIAKICSNIPFSKINIKGNNLFAIFLYYIFIVICVYVFRKNKISFLKMLICMKNKKNQINNIYYFNKVLKKINVVYCNSFKKLLVFLSVIVIMFSSIFFFYNIENLNKELEIYLVDVGQGDCIIIKTEDKNIIIDSGEGNSKDKYDYGKNVVFQHLLKLGINKIDFMIFSHMDSDHAGGLMYILENMKVENVLIGLQTEDSENLQTLMRILNQKKNIRLSILEAGMKVKLDEISYIDVLWPSQNNLILENPLNNNSLVFKFYYKNLSILFTGDIEQIAEKKIVELYKKELKSDILKVAHHGSKTSTINSFLEYSKPQIALIGVGKNNKFSHPSECVISCLENINCKIYRTDKDGEILISLKKGEIFILKKILTIH